MVEDVELLKFQAQIEALQVQEENVKKNLKTMSPIQKMPKDREIRRLKQQLSGLKAIKENLTEKMEPLKDKAMAISQAISTKLEYLKAIVEQMEIHMLEPLSEQSVEKIKAKEGELPRVVVDAKVQYAQFQSSVYAVRKHA